MTHCDSSLDKNKWKHINVSYFLKRTAWVINVDGFGNEDIFLVCTRTLLPSKGSSFSSESKKNKNRERERECVKVEVTFLSTKSNMQ